MSGFLRTYKIGTENIQADSGCAEYYSILLFGREVSAISRENKAFIIGLFINIHKSLDYNGS